MRVMVLILVLLAAFRTTAATGAPGPATLLADGWRQYKDRFLTSEGRIVDNANGGISHSEGQGYAMLIAERLNDRPTFEAIWQWTQSNLLVRGDSLASLALESSDTSRCRPQQCHRRRSSHRLGAR